MTRVTREQIAEMRANGYDRATLAQAENDLALTESADHLCEEIESAFSGVTLGQGIGLREAQAIDDYLDKPTQALCRAEDEKDDWRKLPIDGLWQYHGSLSFFDAEGFRFHLPAFMIAELQEVSGPSFKLSLTGSDLLDHRRYELLTAAQRLVVRKYLLLLRDDPNFFHSREKIQEALLNYWTEG